MACYNIKGEFLLTEENFQNGKIDCFLDGTFSVFDYNLKNALLFSQGDWGLIRRDLLLANVEDESIQALENGPCAEIIRAFRVRRELIHYKKVCLHLFEEARTIERDLKQSMSYFFWYDGDNAQQGALAHMQAIVALARGELDGEGSLLDLDHIRIAMERHEKNSCELNDRKLLYVLASGAWMYHRGIIKALQDARDIAKAICVSPRHPDGEENGDRPFKLRSLPHSMQVEQAVFKAESEDPLEISRMKKRILKEDENQYVKTSDFGLTKGSTAMRRILACVEKDLNWPEDAVKFLALSIAARGGFKALAIVEELGVYNRLLSSLPTRIEQVIKMYKDAQLNVVDEFINCQDDFVSDEDLSAAVFRHREIHHLNGSLKACRENARWVSIIESLNFDPTEKGSKSSRLFVAGDDASANGAFVPNGFQLGSFVAASRKILDQVLIPTMRLTLKNESWPPAVGSRRTRVLAFDKITIKDAKIGKKKLAKCCDCSGFFDSRWIRHQICTVCEAVKREKSVGDICMFMGCKASTEAYCPHHRRCFICDSPHSCDKCRLSIGNGEVVSAFVETILPKVLLLDFDRTLCSTKSGASPLPKRSSKRNSKEGYSHSIDPELKAAVLAQKNHGKSYVITRNSHKCEIETFLEMNGLIELSNNVHIVPKGVKKGAYIKNMLPWCNEGDQFLFVDDDIRELIGDEWLRSSSKVHRLLFRRY